MIRIWAHSTDADVIILCETWLSRSVLNKDIRIDGYNVYRTDQPKCDWGVANLYQKLVSHECASQ